MASSNFRDSWWGGLFGGSCPCGDAFLLGEFGSSIPGISCVYFNNAHKLVVVFGPFDCFIPRTRISESSGEHASVSFSFCLTWHPQLQWLQLSARLVRHCFRIPVWHREYFCQRLIFNFPPLCGDTPPSVCLSNCRTVPQAQTQFICFSFWSWWMVVRYAALN